MKINYLAVSIALALSYIAHADTVYDYSNGSTGNIAERIEHAADDDGGKVIMNISGNVTFDGSSNTKIYNSISLTQNVLPNSDNTPGVTIMNIYLLSDARLR